MSKLPVSSLARPRSRGASRAVDYVDLGKTRPNRTGLRPRDIPENVQCTKDGCGFSNDARVPFHLSQTRKRDLLANDKTMIKLHNSRKRAFQRYVRDLVRQRDEIDAKEKLKKDGQRVFNISPYEKSLRQLIRATLQRFQKYEKAEQFALGVLYYLWVFGPDEKCLKEGQNIFESMYIAQSTIIDTFNQNGGDKSQKFYEERASNESILRNYEDFNALLNAAPDNIAFFVRALIKHDSSPKKGAVKVALDEARKTREDLISGALATSVMKVNIKSMTN